MGRTVRDTNLETRAARLRLTARRKPYWRVLETGLHLGYRRTKEGGGSWVARRFIGEGRYTETKVGVADDLQDADGVTLRSFKQAQDAAREWWRIEQRRELGHAPDDGAPILSPRRWRPTLPIATSAAQKGWRRTGRRQVFASSPSLEMSNLASSPRGGFAIGILALPLPRSWRAPERLTTKDAKARLFNSNNADAVRARRATANRTLTVLKAALNHAFHEGRVSSDNPWRKVKPFRGADAPVVRFLSGDECRRLANAFEGAFRHLVSAALLTGSRYGELTRLRPSGFFNREAGTITIRESKSGKPRHVALTDEGRTLFSELAAGKMGRDPIFVRDNGKLWGASHQQRPLDAASSGAARSTLPRRSTSCATPTRARLRCEASQWVSSQRNSATATTPE